MIVEQMSSELAGSKALERWPAYLEDLHARIAHRFLRPEVRTRVYRYLAGLLGDVRPKNGWQMAEAIVERTFAWLSLSRRFSKDYERLPESAETMIYGAMSRLMLRRLAGAA